MIRALPDRAEIASGGFCRNLHHSVWPYAAAVWKIDGKLYCDDCAKSLGAYPYPFEDSNGRLVQP